MESRILTIKKLENGKYYIDLHEYLISLIISIIFIFPLIYIPSKNIAFTIISLLIFWIFLSVIMTVVSFFGKKGHKKIMEQKVFLELQKKGFNIEKIGNYNGLISIKNGRTIRVFYNWNKLAEGPLSFADIDINIYFEPPFSQTDPKKIDEAKLKKLTKKYETDTIHL